MSDCSDDDMPELESVSSSEYITDDDDFNLESDPVADIPQLEQKGEHYTIAMQWFEQDKSAIDRQVDIIAVYLYSPVMYGHAHQSDEWLKWCKESGLLISDTNYNTGCLTDHERQVIDLLDSALQYCRSTVKDKTSPDELASLLKLAREIQDKQKELSYEEAVRMARQSKWFIVMVDDVKVNPSQVQGTRLSQYPLELGCLYAVNQTAEHVVKFVKEGRDFCKEFQDRVQSDEEMGEQLKKNGDDLYTDKKHKEAVEEYSTAIPCFPYNSKLYTNRALAYMELKDFKSSLSDGLRAVILNPSFPKGYIRYIVALRACGETGLMQRITNEYHRRFPSAADRSLLKKALDDKKAEPSQDDQEIFVLLKAMCKRASESFLERNIKDAIVLFEQAQSLSEKEKGWKNCLQLTEWKKFDVSIHFAYGLALLDDNSLRSADLALKEFQTILEQHRHMHFVPAHWGAARALVLLSRHSHALLTARNGLEQLPLVKIPPNFTWPGTDTVMKEVLLPNIEINLQKIQESCEPACAPDAICRYGNCMLHHKSSSIRIVSEDYKGHVLLVCSASCSIAYHPTCWRRFKNESVINSDRDFVLTPCPTPDCSGEVTSVHVYDLNGKCKIKFEPPPNKASTPTDSFAAHLGKKKAKKALKSKTDSTSSLKRLHSDNGNSDNNKEAVSKKTTSEASSTKGSVSSEEGVARKTSVLSSEDMRKLEDRLEVIDRRQAEVEEGQNKESPKGKSKKKKEKNTLAQEQLGFEYSDRALMTGASPEEESKNKVPKWVPDAESPFQPPEHLREEIEQFESKEVPSMGLVPRLPLKKEPKDFEYTFSYFRELFKKHGGLRPTDPIITDALALLPGDKKGLVENAGGLESFLLMDPSFKSLGELICLCEDAPAITASINSMEDSGGAENGWSDVGRKSKRKKGKNSYDADMRGKSERSTDYDRANNVDESSNVNSNSPLFSPSQGKPSYPPGSASSQKSEGNLKSDPLPRPKLESTKNKENGIANIQSRERNNSPDNFKLSGKHPVINDKELPKDFKGTKTELVCGGQKEPWKEPKPVIVLKEVGVSACPRMVNKKVMVDLIQPVESFRDRYEIALKEKEDLQSRLERSEDQKYKMQRDHRREMERTQKQSRAEAKEEYQCKVDDLERKVGEGKERLVAEKKDHNEQTRSLKTEIKSLSDKIDRMKKDAARKERQHEGDQIRVRADLEHAQSEKRKVEDKLKGQIEQFQRTLRRAMETEVEVLNMRRESILRPVEMRLREVEGMLLNLPKDHEHYREWDNFRDKLKTSLDSFVNATDDQVKQVRAGKPLAQLDRVPNPAVPLPPQLATFRMPFMRPPFMPMMVRPPNVPSASNMPSAPFDPALPRPQVPTTIGGALAPPTGPVPPGSLPQPAAVGTSGVLPSGGQQPNLFNDPSPGLPELETSVGSKKMSSFDRIVEKLAPDYPQCSKNDFKTVLREVRRRNANSLSGLSLDNIISQIRAILDIRSGRVTSPTSGATASTPPPTNKSLTAGTVISGKGKRRQGQKGQPATASKKSLPPVAVAEPPKSSEIEYDNDGSCIICYEDMTDEDSSTLNCGHIFHSECIRSWFNEQSTCPTCRNHSLLPDDYPTLK